MPIQIAVLASGGGTNLQALLDHMQGNAAYAVALVASDRPRAGALARAKQSHVATHVIGGQGTDAAPLLAALGLHRVQLVVLAGYLKLVPAPVVEAFAGRMLNIHPALLPAFGGKGMYGRRVHEAVIASGTRFSGPTVHLVDEHYDKGTILAQWPVPVLAADTPDTLAARVLEAEHALLPAVVQRACERLAASQPIVPMQVIGNFEPTSTNVEALRCVDALVSA